MNIIYEYYASYSTTSLEVLMPLDRKEEGRDCRKPDFHIMELFDLNL